MYTPLPTPQPLACSAVCSIRMFAQLILQLDICHLSPATHTRHTGKSTEQRLGRQTDARRQPEEIAMCMYGA